MLFRSVLAVQDSDGDPTDNGSGTEVFDAGALLGSDGVALATYPIGLSSGAYSTSFPTSSFSLGSISLQSSTDLYLSGTPTLSSHSGLIGFGVDEQKLASALTAAGAPEELLRVLTNLPDLDMDHDGVDETISMAFEYSGPACGLK